MKEGWSLEKLKDVCEIKPKKSEVKKKIDGKTFVSFVPMTDLGIDNKFFSGNESKALDEVYKGYTYFQDGDVILAKITPCFENGKLGIARKLSNGVGFGSSEFIPFRPKKNILDSEYLYYFLNQNSFRVKGRSLMQGAVGHKRIQPNFFENQLIPLPSIKEQKKIVNILNNIFTALDQAKENIQRNITNAEELFQSKLNVIFSENKDINYQSVTNISTIINGYNFKSQDFSEDNEIKSIKITNVGVKVFVENDSSRLPNDYYEEYSKVRVSEGNIVLALTRTIISGGVKVAMVPASYDGALINQRVAAIVPDTNIIDGNYLYYYLNSKVVYDYIVNNVNSLMQPNLSITDLKEMPVPVLKLDEQRMVVKLIDKLHNKIKRYVEINNEIIDRLELLRESVLEKAFKGEMSLTKSKLIKNSKDDT